MDDVILYASCDTLFRPMVNGWFNSVLGSFVHNRVNIERKRCVNRCLIKSLFNILKENKLSHTDIINYNTNIFISRFHSIFIRLFKQETKTLLKQLLSMGRKIVSHEAYRITSYIQKCL